MSKKTSENNTRLKRQQTKPPADRPVVFVDRSELPVHYDRTGVSLIARDPDSVYAYWEISPSSLREVKSKLGEAYKNSIRTLRMLDITGIDFNGTNAKGQFDIDLDPKAQSRYIILPNDNATVCADLGLKTAEGVFYPLARSNMISTPSANESDCMDTTWVKVKHKQGSKPFVVARTFSLPPKQENAVQTSTEKAQTGEYEEDAGKTPSRGNADVLGINEAGKTPARRNADARDTGTPEMTGEAALPSARVQPKGPGEKSPTAAPRGHVDLRPEGVFNEREIISSFITNHIDSSEEAAFSAGIATSSSFFADLADVSSAASGGGGSERQRLQQGKDFFLHLDADFIVYGKTKPGATVTLDDQPIALRRDGSFTMRFALPDGMVPLNFLGQSPDGSDKKNISLTVGRITTVLP
jgi:hypothetical protein